MNKGAKSSVGGENFAPKVARSVLFGHCGVKNDIAADEQHLILARRQKRHTLKASLGDRLTLRAVAAYKHTALGCAVGMGIQEKREAFWRGVVESEC